MVCFAGAFDGTDVSCPTFLKQASPYHASSVAQPHGAVHITKLMKDGQDGENDPRYSWRRIAYIDVLIDGAACVHRASANAETVDGAVPLRIVFPHTVSSKKERKASDECKKRMILRSIEAGVECNHPNLFSAATIPRR